MTLEASVKITSDTKDLKKLVKKLKKLRNAGVDVGFLGGERHREVPEATVAEIATIHEFGSDDGKIPERPFMRNTVKKHKNYVSLLARESGKVFEKRQSSSTMIAKMGETVRSDMIQEIAGGNFTPLADSTVRAKGSSKPLIRTGFMWNSITWRSQK